MASAADAPVSHRGFVATVKALRRYAQNDAAIERCDFCNVPISAQHRHLLEVEPCKVICVCDPCALRFQNVTEGRFRLIRRDAQSLPDLRFRDGLWESFALPINLVFFVRHKRDEAEITTAYYPSPAGATESLLPMDAWQTLISDNPILGHLEPEVDALLVNRVGPARQYFFAPIDRCFELSGLIRRHWRGFTGGEEVWSHIDNFFVRLAEAAQPAERLKLSHENHA